MNKITESHIEELAITELEELGWQYIYGPQIAFDGEFPERDNYQDIILKERLRQAIARINADVPYPAQEEALQKVLRVGTSDLLKSNEDFHNYLVNGVDVEYHSESGTRGDKIFLLDFSPAGSNNEFLVLTSLL